MFRVVGCSNCDALWIVEDEPETTQCPRCRTRHTFRRLRAFVTTDSKDEARDVRAAMLAARQGGEDAVDSFGSVAEMEAMLEEVGIDDAEYLAANGLDPEEIEAAGESRTASGRSKTRRERVLEAIDTLEEPTEAEIVAYVLDHGVPAEYARTAIEKLARMGDITQTGSGYRRV